MASVSENQYDPPQKTRPTIRPIVRPEVPPKMAPTPMNRAPRAARRTNVLMVFLLMSLPATPDGEEKFQCSIGGEAPLQHEIGAAGPWMARSEPSVEVPGVDVDARDAAGA